MKFVAMPLALAIALTLSACGASSTLTVKDAVDAFQKNGISCSSMGTDTKTFNFQDVTTLSCEDTSARSFGGVFFKTANEMKLALLEQCAETDSFSTFKKASYLSGMNWLMDSQSKIYTLSEIQKAVGGSVLSAEQLCTSIGYKDK